MKRQFHQLDVFSAERELPGAGLASPFCVATQGKALQRADRAHAQRDGVGIWIGGDVYAAINVALHP